VDEGLDNDVGDEGSDEITHAAAQGCLSTPCPTSTGKRSSNRAPKQRLLKHPASTSQPGDWHCHVVGLLVVGEDRLI
jgi:hypothetical protein